jgi:hypothetical protein
LKVTLNQGEIVFLDRVGAELLAKGSISIRRARRQQQAGGGGVETVQQAAFQRTWSGRESLGKMGNQKIRRRIRL